MTKTTARMFFIVFALLLVGCGRVNTLKIKEVMEGSEDWIRELTQGMIITVQHPEGEVRLYQSYDLVVTIENHGKHEPHLSTAIVDVFEGPNEGLSCVMVEPEPLETRPFDSGVLFYMPPKQVARDAPVTTVHIQCTFTQPGIYELYFSVAFRESTHGFVNRVFVVTAR